MAQRISILFGMASALTVAVIGPIYAAPLLLCALPITFVTASRLVLGSPTKPHWAAMLIAFGLAWLLLFPVAPIVHPGSDRDIGPTPMWLALGIVPLLAGIFMRVRLVCRE